MHIEMIHTFYHYKEQSRDASYFFLNNYNPFNTKPIFTTPPPYAPIYFECLILRNVMSSADKDKLGTIFENCKIAEMIRTAVEKSLKLNIITFT